MDGSLTDASSVGQASKTTSSPSSVACREEALLHPPSSPKTCDATPGSANGASGCAESLSSLPPQIQGYLRAFVARAIAESPQAERARSGRERYYPGVPDSQWS